uniref:Serine/threonine-protein phosphatase 7 long form n=1 Tax=Anthurium amnicola TaxID=1678845 RepID=A0A1D1YN28_9ARAE
MAEIGRGILYPGPEDPSILISQAHHRYEAIYNWEDVGTLKHYDRYRCMEGWTLDDEQMTALVRDSGLCYVTRFYGVRLNWTRITTSVERWRCETNTPLSSWGDAITLQDVSILSRLPIDGEVVTGIVVKVRA